MISFLSGKLILKQNNKIHVLTSSGVGYEVHVSAPFFVELRIDQEIQLHTYLKVSENAMELFGFRNADEKEFFELLISVSGVGPKTALNVLALGSMEQIQSAIARGDVSYLTQVSGIGKKTAERLVVELKSKMVERGTGNEGGRVENSEVLGEVVEALVGMGYSREEARVAVKDLSPKDKDVSTLLKKALRLLSN